MEAFFGTVFFFLRDNAYLLSCFYLVAPILAVRMLRRRVKFEVAEEIFNLTPISLGLVVLGAMAAMFLSHQDIWCEMGTFLDGCGEASPHLQRDSSGKALFWATTFSWYRGLFAFSHAISVPVLGFIIWGWTKR